MRLEFLRIKAILDRHRTLFDLQVDGLGQELCAAATDGVQACIAGEHAPDGTPWTPLSEAYEEWKSYQFPGQQMAVLYGLMADPREVAGEIDVSPERAVVTYGTSEEARQQAVWFQEGSGRPGHGSPPRPFWGFTDESLARVRAILEKRLKDG